MLKTTLFLFSLLALYPIYHGYSNQLYEPTLFYGAVYVTYVTLLIKNLSGKITCKNIKGQSLWFTAYTFWMLRGAFLWVLGGGLTILAASYFKIEALGILCGMATIIASLTSVVFRMPLKYNQIRKAESWGEFQFRTIETLRHQRVIVQLDNSTFIVLTINKKYVRQVYVLPQKIHVEMADNSCVVFAR